LKVLQVTEIFDVVEALYDDLYSQRSQSDAWIIIFRNVVLNSAGLKAEDVLLKNENVCAPLICVCLTSDD